MGKKILLFLAILVLCGCVSFAQDRQAHPPNIIFILVDDQGYGDVGVFWQNQRAQEGLPYELTPHLDQMANEGAMLTQHYCASPVCAPSRASLMLGVSQGHANVRDNQFDKALADNYTMPSTLKTLGYSTAAIGKWGLQGSDRWEENGDDWPARPSQRGFDYFLGYMRHSDGHEHYPKEGLYRGRKEVWLNGKIITDQLDKCYTADLWTAAAKHWIINHQQGNKKDQPFFLYLAYDTPHAVDELPTQKYPEGGGLHGGLQWTGEAGHFINTASGEPDTYIYPEYADATYDDDQDPATAKAPWPETYKRYATANRRIDDGVGDVIQLLKDLQIDDNTLIVYTSDNGPSIETYLGDWQRKEEKYLPVFFESFGPFDGIKRDTWEGGIRMPTIAWWPGHIPAGNILTEPSIQYDWAPTFLDAAGVVAPARMDGVSLLPSLTGRGQQQQSTVYIEYYQGGKTPSFEDFAPNHRGRLRKQMQVIRLGDYVGVRYNVQSAKDNFEIYDVTKDPEQTTNLAITNKKVKVDRRISFQKVKRGRIGIKKLQQFMKARVLQERLPAEDISRPYDSTLISSVNPKVRPGLQWHFYKGPFPWIPQVHHLKAKDSGVTSLPDVNLLKKNKEGVLFFNGYIRIPKDGEYTFYLKAGSRAFLRIHDIQVIDADYGYRGGKVKKTTLFLKAGLHPFRLYYATEPNNEPELQLEWSGPELPRQVVGKHAFFRNKYNN